MPTGIFASESVTKLLERFAYQVNHTIHNSDEASLHDLRVSTRRFSQSLYLFKAAFASKDVKKIRGRLKQMMELTNSARDCDVALDLLPKTELPGAAALSETIQARRKEAVKLLMPVLKRWGARDTSSKWRAALHPNGMAQEPIDESVRERIERQIKRVIKDGTHAGSAHHLHQVRIAGKKLRYSFEVLRPLYAEKLDAGIADIKILQSLLGDMNDCHAVRDLVRELGGDTEIEAWLKKRQKKKAQEFRTEWPALEDSLRAALAIVRRPARKPVVRVAAAHATAQQA